LPRSLLQFYGERLSLATSLYTLKQSALDFTHQVTATASFIDDVQQEF